MKLLYENSLEDLLAFNRYHADHSPSYKLAILWLFRIFPLFIFVYVVLLVLTNGHLEAIVIWVIFGVLLVFGGPWFLRNRIQRHLRRLYSEGSTKGMIGEHELELTEDDLIERTLFGENRTRLRAIEKVVTNRGYTFIFLTAFTGHVIPQDAVQDGDYEAFVEGLKGRMVEKRGEQGIRADRLRDERFFER